MQVTATEFPGVLILEPKVFGDALGFFFESFNQQAFDAAIGRSVRFVQDNHSRSAKGVLVRVTSGRVFDVAADIDTNSVTYRRWVGVELSAENHRQIWIPPGFAHGFLVLSDSADFVYKTTDYYAPASEKSVR